MMRFNRDGGIQDAYIVLNSEKLEQKEKFQYLGVEIEAGIPWKHLLFSVIYSVIYDIFASTSVTDQSIITINQYEVIQTVWVSI